MAGIDDPHKLQKLQRYRDILVAWMPALIGVAAPWSKDQRRLCNKYYNLGDQKGLLC